MDIKLNWMLFIPICIYNWYLNSDVQLIVIIIVSLVLNIFKH